jgi:putative transposase
MTVLQAYRFALDPTAAQQRALGSHCGAARKAYNEGLAQVKRCLDQREAERSYGVPDGLLIEVPWSLPALRRWWNQVKDERAPWWRENSKEAYNSGLDALARGLKAWSDSRSGKRRGPKVAFPKFRAAHRARPSCRFSTGAIRVDDRSHVVLPRIGRIKTHEPATALLGKVATGQARVLAATVSFDGRRWYCSFTVETERALRPPAHAGRDGWHPVVGVDLGVRDLLVAAAPDGTQVARIPAPRSLAAVQARLRALQRRAARQQGSDRRSGQLSSRRWRKTAARIGRVHARAANIRRDALHKATTRLAQRHQVIVIEDLAVANLTRRKPGAGAGGRGLNRALADAAPAELRRQLGYKTTWYGSALLVADRWYPSSKTCSACGRRKPSLTLAERTWTCDGCGAAHDRDLNAATNLARLSEHASRVEIKPAGSGPVAGRGAGRKTRAATAATAGGCETSTPHSGHHAAGKTGTAPRKERLPYREHSQSLA